MRPTLDKLNEVQARTWQAIFLEWIMINCLTYSMRVEEEIQLKLFSRHRPPKRIIRIAVKIQWLDLPLYLRSDKWVEMQSVFAS